MRFHSLFVMTSTSCLRRRSTVIEQIFQGIREPPSQFCSKNNLKIGLYRPSNLEQRVWPTAARAHKKQSASGPVVEICGTKWPACKLRCWFHISTGCTIYLRLHTWLFWRLRWGYSARRPSWQTKELDWPVFRRLTHYRYDGQSLWADRSRKTTQAGFLILGKFQVWGEKAEWRQENLTFWAITCGIVSIQDVAWNVTLCTYGRPPFECFRRLTKMWFVLMNYHLFWVLPRGGIFNPKCWC